MKNKTKVYVGMDVHKDSVMIAALPEGAREPTLVKRVSRGLRGLRWMPVRLARAHEVRACYEASGAGCVLDWRIRSLGFWCGIVAPSLFPGVQGKSASTTRKTPRRWRVLYRAGDLVTIRVTTGWRWPDVRVGGVTREQR